MSKDTAAPKPELFFVIDIETDGQVAGLNSMLSLGCVVVDPRTRQILDDTFYRKMLPLSNLLPDPATLEWWQQFPDAYKEATSDAIYPRDAMVEFFQWVQGICDREGRNPAPACMPSWDFGFVLYYLMRYLGQEGFDLFGHRPLCIKSLCYAFMGEEFRGLRPPEHWQTTKHDHTALADARGHAESLCVLLTLRHQDRYVNIACEPPAAESVQPAEEQFALLKHNYPDAEMLGDGRGGWTIKLVLLTPEGFDKTEITVAFDISSAFPFVAPNNVYLPGFSGTLPVAGSACDHPILGGCLVYPIGFLPWDPRRDTLFSIVQSIRQMLFPRRAE